MPIHFGPRLHKFTHNLFKTRDEVETAELFEKVMAKFAKAEILEPEDRRVSISALAQCVSEGLQIDTASEPFELISKLVHRVIEYEGIWQLPEIDWSVKRETSDWWEIREALNQQYAWARDFDTTFDLVADALIAMLHPIALNWTQVSENSDFDVTVQTPLLNRGERPSRGRRAHSRMRE